MSSRDNRIYHSRRPLKIISGVVLTLLLVAALLMILIFIGFRKYIVYTSDGVRLEVPWLREDAAADSPAPGVKMII